MTAERTLEDVLREVKDDLLCYCVVCEYGAFEMGLDDSGMPDEERSCRIVAAPGGFLGGLRVIFQGTVASVKELDLYVEPTPVSNPPTREELKDPETYRERPGAFVYGSPDSVADWPAKLAEWKAER